MNSGIRTIVYPVTDLARAKAAFQELLGVQPMVDQPYYVGFQLGDQQIGLAPNDHKTGMTPFYHVDDIKKSLQSLLDSGAQIEQALRDVGGGKLVASVKDADGNVIGLIQEA